MNPATNLHNKSSRISMCVRHVILLIVQTDRVLGGP